MTKPLLKPMMTSHQSHFKEQTSMKSYWNYLIFIDAIAFEIIICNFATIFVHGLWANKTV